MVKPIFTLEVKTFSGKVQAVKARIVKICISKFSKCIFRSEGKAFGIILRRYNNRREFRRETSRLNRRFPIYRYYEIEEFRLYREYFIRRGYDFEIPRLQRYSGSTDPARYREYTIIETAEAHRRAILHRITDRRIYLYNFEQIPHFDNFR